MGPLEVTVNDSLFFKYTIDEKTDLEDKLLLLNVSNREDLQIYINSHSYPSSKKNEFEYALGDLPERVLKSMFKN